MVNAKAETPNEKPLVGIVVLTWNQCELTLDCLTSLEQLNYPNHVTIVVDNGSSDHTVETVEAHFPLTDLIANSSNLGYVGGNNIGISRALDLGAEYVLLLNNDTAVDPAMLDHLVNAMETDSSIGITGPKMLYFDYPDRIWCAGNTIDWKTGECHRLQAENIDKPTSEPELVEVDYITGCAILIRRKVIEQTGTLDSRFFIYYEESDWCQRARREGWRTVYVPQSRLWHKVSASMGATSPATDYYMTRNVFLFMAKNRSGFRKLWSLAWTFYRHVRIVAVYSLKNRTQERLVSRNVRIMAMRDALMQRWGKMGDDVSKLCYGSNA